MTRVCIVGEAGAELRYELLSRETAREALAAYDLAEPFANTVAVDTISLGAAIALLNDLDWYLARFARDALVLEPSISETEWLSRALASAVRDGAVDPAETGTALKVYGLVDGELVDPMYARRRDGSLPEYDLRAVEDTVVIRIAGTEFGE
ncbi:hypothetical protein BRC90_11645 [Halobacteriales archaeon QS_4_69_34]|nr:MAG: hypothetical protein BRC90_11645 [Halobacteriales archaeon QS_4_69_34]